jgi:hypothetical protein
MYRVSVDMVPTSHETSDSEEESELFNKRPTLTVDNEVRLGCWRLDRLAAELE